MSRRLIALLVIWVGLLGAAYPVLACAANMQPAGGCCPGGTDTPCDEQPPATGAAVCCVAAPAPAQAAVLDAFRSGTLIEHDVGAPDATGPPGPPHAAVSHAACRQLVPLAVPPRDDLSLTYLRTARLRL